MKTRYEFKMIPCDQGRVPGFDPYLAVYDENDVLIFSSAHDGSGAVKAAVTPVRVVCNNTLNLALQTAKRSWSMAHTGNIMGKVKEAGDTLFMAEAYGETGHTAAARRGNRVPRGSGK